MSSIWAGVSVRLRPPEPDDERVFARFHEHSADQRNEGIIRPPMAVAELVRAAAEHVRDSRPPDTFQLTIERISDGSVIGGIATQNVDRRSGNFSYGIIIGHEHQQHGYATEAITILLTYMFGECRYNKCEVGTYEFNTGSIALHRKLGFVEEGRLRKHFYSAGSFHDMILMGLTVDEFADRHHFHSL